MSVLPAPAAVPGRLLTATEAAAYFGVHEKTVRRWALAGKLSGYRAGGTWGFREAEVRALRDRSRS